LKILEERRSHREEVINEAKEWAMNLPFKASVILIGSYARGDFNEWSDVDVVLISELTGSPLDRLKKINYPAEYEVIPLTLVEFMRMLRKKNPIAVEAVERGIILRDDFNIEKLRKQS